MLQEAIDVFHTMLQKEGDHLITDAYIPKDGEYRLIIMDDDQWKMKDPINITFNKKTGEAEVSDPENYALIQELDYKSKLLEMNKSMDPKKKIHCNNYLSLAVKKETIRSGILTNDIIHRYFDVFRNPMKKYEKKSASKALYQATEERLGVPDIHLIDKIEQFVLSHDIWEGMDLDKKNYAKVFFIYPDEFKTKELYAKENERYLFPNIYNRNDFNMERNGKIVGLPNDNITLNDNKPYLKNKTRKNEIPHLLSQEDALLRKKFFDYLFGQASQKKYHVYVDTMNHDMKAYTNREHPQNLSSGYYLRISMEKTGAEICDADAIIHYDTKLDHPFYLKNFSEIPEDVIKNSKLPYGAAVDDKWELFSMINSVFFDRKLLGSMFCDASDIRINDPCLKRAILKCRDIFIQWFWKGEDIKISKIMDDIFLLLIQNSIVNDNIFAAQRQINLRWSLLEYLSDPKLGVHMGDIRNQLRKHINTSGNKDWNFVNDEEYCYAVGQGVSYLLSLSKANLKSKACINPFLSTKNTKVLHRHLENLFKKYDYCIDHNAYGGKVTQLFSQLTEYKPKEIKTAFIIAGFNAPCLVYEKRKKETKKED